MAAAAHSRKSDCADADPAWDQFVHRTPGGHHVQTSLWAQVKAVLGWRAARVVVRHDGDIAAGCQVLLRDLPLIGAIAYAPRGPLVAGDDPSLREEVLAELHELAKREHIIFLKAQPPAGAWSLAEAMLSSGFRRSALEAGPTATVLVDLRRPVEQILSSMRAGTRSNVRKAQRKGVTIRTGGADDLDVFAELVEQTSRRQGFAAYPARYYGAMWEVFCADNHAQLLIAEHEGRALSALLLIAYGDCAIYKMGAWSGERGTVHPNELLHWTAMNWARDAGYGSYDFEGIPMAVAQALVRGETPPEARRGTAHFKLGFGGEVTLSPSALDYTYRPALAALINGLAPRIASSRELAHRLLGRGS